MNNPSIDHVIIRVCKYGYEHQNFTPNELIDKGIIQKGEWDYILTLLDDTRGASSNPNAIAKLINKGTGPMKADWIFTMLPSALFSYVDHIELQEAKNYAREAKILSYWAIGISVFSLILSSVIGILQIILN